MTANRRPRPIARSAARLGAVQALYQMDIAGTDVGEVLAQFSARASGDSFDEGQCGEADYKLLKEIVDGVVREQPIIDPTVNRTLDAKWPLTRLDVTLRSILRAGAYELVARTDVPVATVIGEYLDVAKAFYDARETGFVNGLLDALAKEVRR